MMANILQIALCAGLILALTSTWSSGMEMTLSRAP
jgi:hypothetical protein